MSRANYRKGVKTNDELASEDQARKLNRMNNANAAKVKSKDTGPGFVEQLVTSIAKTSAGSSPKGGDTDTGSTDSDTQAYKQIGDAGASMAKTYKENKAAKSAS